MFGGSGVFGSAPPVGGGGPFASGFYDGPSRSVFNTMPPGTMPPGTRPSMTIPPGYMPGMSPPVTMPPSTMHSMGPGPMMGLGPMMGSTMGRGQIMPPESFHYVDKGWGHRESAGWGAFSRGGEHGNQHFLPRTQPEKLTNWHNSGPTALAYIAERFDLAQREAVRRITNETDDRMKVLIYGYYKQAKEGNVKGKRPGVLHHFERTLWDEWARHEGMPREEAMDRYIKTIELLDEPYLPQKDPAIEIMSPEEQRLQHKLAHQEAERRRM